MRLSAPTRTGGSVEAVARKTPTIIDTVRRGRAANLGTQPAAEATKGAARATAKQTPTRTRVRPRPMRTARVRLLAAASVSMSRRLLMARMAQARAPVAQPAAQAAGGTRSSFT